MYRCDFCTSPVSWECGCFEEEVKEFVSGLNPWSPFFQKFTWNLVWPIMHRICVINSAQGFVLNISYFTSSLASSSELRR